MKGLVEAMPKVLSASDEVLNDGKRSRAWDGLPAGVRVCGIAVSDGGGEIG